MGVAGVLAADDARVLAGSSRAPLRPRVRSVRVVAVRRHRLLAVLAHLQRAT